MPSPSVFASPEFSIGAKKLQGTAPHPPLPLPACFGQIASFLSPFFSAYMPITSDSLVTGRTSNHPYDSMAWGFLILSSPLPPPFHSVTRVPNYWVTSFYLHWLAYKHNKPIWRVITKHHVRIKLEAFPFLPSLQFPLSLYDQIHSIILLLLLLPCSSIVPLFTTPSKSLDLLISCLLVLSVAAARGTSSLPQTTSLSSQPC